MAEKHDIHIDQGANFRMFLDYRNPDNTAINISGYTFRMRIKDKIGGSTTHLNADAFVTIDNAAEGRILVNIPAATTAGLNFERGVYDIYAIGGGVTTRLVWGEAFLHRGISL